MKESEDSYDMTQIESFKRMMKSYYSVVKTFEDKIAKPASEIHREVYLRAYKKVVLSRDQKKSL